MKSHHTITITIPTAKIVYATAGLLAGVTIGAALAWCLFHGVQIWTPLVGLPMLAARRPRRTLPQAVRSIERRTRPQADRRPLTSVQDVHPAVAAFATVPIHIRVALSDMVDRTLAAKYRIAA